MDAVGCPWQAAVAAAQAVAGGQDYPEAALYVVATPIGNLADLSLRALHVLGRVDQLCCEDTRHTQALLAACRVTHPPLLAVHQHNEAQAAQTVLGWLARGQRVAYVSDAGTPAVSDPGARLVRAVAAAGHRVLPIPGASSVTALLSVAGACDEADAAGFVFAGFLPQTAQARVAAIARLAAEPRAVVCLEAPHRIAALAQALAALGQRPVTLGRELTKQFETVVTLPAQGLADWLAQDAARLRGEFALVLHPQPPQPTLLDTRVLHLLLAELPLKTAVHLAVEITQQPKKALYAAALAWRQAADEAGGSEGGSQGADAACG